MNVPMRMDVFHSVGKNFMSASRCIASGVVEPQYWSFWTSVQHLTLLIIIYYQNDWRAFGLFGAVLGWSKSYKKNRDFFVSISNFSTEQTGIPCGVPEGSVLGAV